MNTHLVRHGLCSDSEAMAPIETAWNRAPVLQCRADVCDKASFCQRGPVPEVKVGAWAFAPDRDILQERDTPLSAWSLRTPLWTS